MPRHVSSEEAVSLLANAKRVLVIGCSGGGKTTFSAKIAACRDLEFQSLDRDVRWLPGWVERDRAGQRAIIEQLLGASDGSWTAVEHLRSTSDLCEPI